MMSSRGAVDALIESYARTYDAAGTYVPRAEIERQVIADLHVVDRARAEGDLKDNLTQRPRDPAAPSPRAAALAEAERANGVTVDRGGDGPGVVQRFRVLHQNAQKVGERWGYAVGRIKRILEGVRRDTTSLVTAVEDAELGALALEYADLWSCFLTRAAPAPLTGKDLNPFRGLSDRDASRMFMRKVEDICDRSTGKLGSWYVK